jgi:hypothetical protein
VKQKTCLLLTEVLFFGLSVLNLPEHSRKNTANLRKTIKQGEKEISPSNVCCCRLLEDAVCPCQKIGQTTLKKVEKIKKNKNFQTFFRKNDFSSQRDGVRESFRIFRLLFSLLLSSFLVLFIFFFTKKKWLSNNVYTRTCPVYSHKARCENMPAVYKADNNPGLPADCFTVFVLRMCSQHYKRHIQPKRKLISLETTRYCGCRTLVATYIKV